MYKISSIAENFCRLVNIIKISVLSLVSPTVKYNLQPYNNEGDTTGGRNLSWFHQQVSPILLELIPPPKKFSLGLDLGCGNCRMAEFLTKLCNNVIGIDIHETHHEANLKNSNYVYVKTSFKNFHGVVDLLFAFGMFDILKRNFGIQELVKKIDKVTTQNSMIIFIYDSNLDDNLFIEQLKSKSFAIELQFTTENIPTKIIAMRKQ